MVKISRRVAVSVTASALALLRPFAAAQSPTFPNRPIRLIVPSPPGGGTDTVSRIIAKKLAETLKWDVVVDNRPGAGTNLGMGVAAKSPADGYTIVMGESANLTMNPFLYANLPFDPVKDLAPIVLVGSNAQVLVISSARPYKSVADLVTAAKAATKPLIYSSGGAGTPGHLTAELWMRRANVQFLHVPYRGGAPAILDLIGGQVDLNFASLPTALGHVSGDRVRALAVTSPTRVPQLPNVPTMEEAGFPGLVAQGLYALLAPTGTPPEILQRYNVEVNKALASPDVREALAKNGVDPGRGSPLELGKLLSDERAKWERVIKDAGVKLDQ